MILKTKKDLEKVSKTTGEGTKENPKVEKLPWNYKIPLYLGYQIKWDSTLSYKEEYTTEYRQWIVYEIKPVFKKSYDSFDCFWHYRNWDFLMEVLLPKMVEDNLLTADIRKKILAFDRKAVILKCFKIIDEHVKDIDYPFVNISDKIKIFNEDEIFI